MCVRRKIRIHFYSVFVYAVENHVHSQKIRVFTGLRKPENVIKLQKQ